MVNEKMTAIADKIRSLLGITGKMGLDAMATNLGTEKTNVTNAFTAVGEKGGNVPASKVSGNLATAIASIPDGVTVQRKTGSFTTNRGSATISCGFQPDIFFFTQNSKDDDYTMTGCFAFAECSNSKLNTATWDRNSNVIDAYASRSTSGVSLSLTGYDQNWEQSNYNGTFSYVAVKYT